MTAGDPEGPERPERASRSVRAEQIVDAAWAVLSAQGPAGLTMRRLADELGIQAPSLYKHFRGKDEVELALVADALWDIGQRCHDAVAAGPPAQATARLCATYRREANAAPHLYRLATQGQLRRDRLPPGLEEWAGHPWYAVTGDPARAQALWSFAHGMVILELDDRYPPGSDLDATWAAGTTAFTALRR